jgi:hypothetical protein
MSISIGRNSKPGVSVGTRNEAGCSVPARASAVRPTTSTASAWSTPEMNVLRPLRTQSEPSRRAVVAMRCEFDPASGSVMAKAMIDWPLAMPGSHRCRCGSVPKRARIVPMIAGETTIISSPVPPALSSSATIASSYMPAPPPPYSAGRLTPRKPSLPASLHSSSIGSCAADFARVYSQPYFADSSATTRRSSCCSLLSLKSTTPPFPRRRRARHRRRPVGPPARAAR